MIYFVNWSNLWLIRFKLLSHQNELKPLNQMKDVEIDLKT